MEGAQSSWTASPRSNTNGKRKSSHSRTGSTLDVDDLFDYVFSPAPRTTSTQSRPIPSTTKRLDIPVASTSKLPPGPPSKRPSLRSSSSHVDSPPRPGSQSPPEISTKKKRTTKEKSVSAKTLNAQQKRRDEAEVRLHANDLNIALKSAYRRRSNYDPSSDSNSNTDDDIDSEDDPSIINDVFWTAREKSLFFHALSRHSRLRLDLVALDVPSKTYLDVLAYVAYLDEISDKAQVSRGELGTGGSFRSEYESSLAGLPSAREVSEGWIRREEKLGERLEDYATKARRINQVLPTVIAEVEEARQSSQRRIEAVTSQQLEKKIPLKIRPTNLENILGHLTPALLSGLEFLRPRASREEALAYAEEYSRNPDAVFDLAFRETEFHCIPTTDPTSDYVTPPVPLPFPTIVNPFATAPQSSVSTARSTSTVSTVASTAASSLGPEESPSRIAEVGAETEDGESRLAENIESKRQSIAATIQSAQVDPIRVDGEAVEEVGRSEPSKGKSITKGHDTSTKQQSTTETEMQRSKSTKSAATPAKELANSKRRDWRRFRISKRRLAAYEPLGEELARTVCALEDMEMGPGLLGGAAEFFNLATLGSLVEKSQGTDAGIPGDVVGVLCRHLKNHVDKIITAAVKLRAAGRVLPEEPTDENSLATPYILSAIAQLSLPATLPTKKRSYTMDTPDELSMERKSAKKRQKTAERSQEQSRSTIWNARIGRLDSSDVPAVGEGVERREGGLERLFRDRRSERRNEGLVGAVQMGPRAFPPAAPSSSVSTDEEEVESEFTVEFEGNGEPSELALSKFQEMEDIEAEELDERLDRDAEREWIEEFGEVSEIESDLEREELDTVGPEVEQVMKELDEMEEVEEEEIIEPERRENGDVDEEPTELDDAPAAEFIDPLTLPQSWRRVSSHRPILKKGRKKQKRLYSKSTREYERKANLGESKSSEFMTLSDGETD